MKIPTRSLRFALPVAAMLLTVTPAAANDPAGAQVLFDDGMKLMTAGNYPEACAKLEESQRLDPGAGTQYNLATCYAKVGKLASAWANLVEVADASRLRNESEREAVARKDAAALEPRLSRMKIEVGPAPVAGLEVKRDGVVVGAAQWGAALPVDQGQHTIDASAPGKKPWHSVVVVQGEASLAKVVVPALADAPVVEPPPSGEHGLGGRKTAALIVGSVGAAGLIAGGVFGVLTIVTKSSSGNECSTQPNCGAQAVSDRNTARTFGDVSTVTFIAGGVLAAAGIALFVTAPTPRATTGLRVRAVPVLAQGTGGVSVMGIW